MQPTLQDTLAYINRTINPDYIIIVQHKANETMDFSQFKPIIPETKEVYKPQKRFTLSTHDYEGLKLVSVTDNFSAGREVYRATCKEEYLEDNLEVVRKLYKGSNIEDRI